MTKLTKTEKELLKFQIREKAMQEARGFLVGSNVKIKTFMSLTKIIERYLTTGK
jgi:hypothetical protein